MEKFGISVTTPEQSQDELFGTDSWAACQLHGKGRPDNITLHLDTEEKDVTSLTIHNSQAQEGCNFDLDVPVAWRNDEWRGLLPYTRERGVDNVDVILVDVTTLHFKHIQVSLLTRKGRFYIMAQRLFQGWVRMKDNNSLFIPSDASHAYPNMDYPELLGEEGLKAMTGLVRENKITESAMPSAATWNPPSLTKQNGWQGGWVLFFNPIINGGRILGEDGTEYFIPGNNLVDVDGSIKMLDPMRGVYFRPKKQEEEADELPMARSCKIA